MFALRIIAGAAIVASFGASVAPATVRPLAVINGRPNGRLIALPVRVNRSGTLWFILDSGARHSVIDTAVAARLGLRIRSTERGSGVGSGTIEQRHAAPVDLAVSTLKLQVADPLVIDLRHTGVRDRYDGLVGFDLFQHAVVRIDPALDTIAVYDPATYRYRGTGAVVPLTSRSRRLFVTMMLTIAGAVPVTHEMRIDTGSEDAASDDLVRKSPQRRTSLQGVGLGTPYLDSSGVFQTVQIGPYAIHQVWGPSNDRPAVGMEILRRFTLTFDVPAGRLYLEPNAHFRDPVPAPA